MSETRAEQVERLEHIAAAYIFQAGNSDYSGWLLESAAALKAGAKALEREEEAEKAARRITEGAGQGKEN